MRRKEVYLILDESSGSVPCLFDTAFTSFEEAQKVVTAIFNETGNISRIRAIYLDNEKNYEENPIPTPYCACCGAPLFDVERIKDINGIKICERCYNKFLEQGTKTK